MLDIHRLVLKPHFFYVDPHRITYDPFPGRYPTRWSIVLNDRKEKEIFRYFGKPDSTVAHRVKHLIKTNVGHISAAEFDKLGAFRFLGRGTPRVDLHVQYYSLVPCLRYYPWGSGSGDFFCNWRSQQFPKLFKLGKKAIFAYSPHNSLVADERMIELCRNYRRWLQVNRGEKLK